MAVPPAMGTFCNATGNSLQRIRGNSWRRFGSDACKTDGCKSIVVFVVSIIAHKRGFVKGRTFADAGPFAKAG